MYRSFYWQCVWTVLIAKIVSNEYTNDCVHVTHINKNDDDDYQKCKK